MIRRQPTAADVIRDLRRGDGVRAEWAPVAGGGVTFDQINNAARLRPEAA